jgi:hypothetical protein
VVAATGATFSNIAPVTTAAAHLALNVVNDLSLDMIPP